MPVQDIRLQIAQKKKKKKYRKDVNKALPLRFYTVQNHGFQCIGVGWWKKKKEFIKWLLKLAQRKVCSLRWRTIKQTEVFRLMKAADCLLIQLQQHILTITVDRGVVSSHHLVSIWNAFKKAANFKMLIFSDSVTRFAQPLAMKVTST